VVRGSHRSRTRAAIRHPAGRSRYPEANTQWTLAEKPVVPPDACPLPATSRPHVEAGELRFFHLCVFVNEVALLAWRKPPRRSTGARQGEPWVNRWSRALHAHIAKTPESAIHGDHRGASGALRRGRLGRRYRSSAVASRTSGIGFQLKLCAVPTDGHEHSIKIGEDLALCVPARVRLLHLANHGVAQPNVERNAAGRSGILSRHRIKLATATLARSRKESRPRKRTGS
jgi:hypothetical protein